MPRRATALRILAVIASGLMIAALVPPFSYATLAWICMVPFLIAVWSLKGDRRARKGFLIGYLTGAIACGIQVSWLSTISWLGVVILGGYLPLYFGAFGAFAATIGNPWHRKGGVSETPLRSLFNAFTHASLWAGLEVLRGWMFTGFGWNGLGIAFHDTLVISQAADILGVAGLSLMLVFFQCVLVQVGHRLMKTGADGIRRPRWDFAATALMVGLLLAYGILRIAGESAKETIPLKALLVQINIPHDGATVLWEMEKVHMAYEDETLLGLKNIADADEKKLQAAVTEEAEGSIELSTPDWVVWPEAALFGRILRTDDGKWGAWMENIESISRVREGQGGGDFDLIYGAIEMEGEILEDGMYPKEDGWIYNSVVVESPEGDLQTFQKHHLVIFGETIPLIDTFPILQTIYEQQSGRKYYGSFNAGTSFDPLPVEVKGETVSIVPAVCFEDTVPRLMRKFLRPEPQVIVNLTNDGWFNESQAAAQHFANARFRAIEFRRPMIRCANTGVTAAIDTTGSTASPETGKPQVILDENGSSFIRDNLLVRLNIPKQPSFSLYPVIGDWGIIFLSVLGLAAAYFFRRHGMEQPGARLGVAPASAETSRK